MYLHFYCPVLHGDVATLKIVRAFAALCVAILTIYVAMLLAMKSQQIANKVTTQLPTTKNGYQQWLFLLAVLAIVCHVVGSAGAGVFTGGSAIVG